MLGELVNRQEEKWMTWGGREVDKGATFPYFDRSEIFFKKGYNP